MAERRDRRALHAGQGAARPSVELGRAAASERVAEVQGSQATGSAATAGAFVRSAGKYSNAFTPWSSAEWMSVM